MGPTRCLVTFEQLKLSHQCRTRSGPCCQSVFFRVGMGRFSIALLGHGEYFCVVKRIAPGADSSEKFASSAKDLECQIDLRTDLLFDCGMVHRTILNVSVCENAGGLAEGASARDQSSR